MTMGTESPKDWLVRIACIPVEVAIEVAFDVMEWWEERT
jgi:hypothetical protein